MLRLLRHKKTGRFFLVGRWTWEEKLAQNFESPLDAIEVCHQFRLRDMELILKSDDWKLNISVPLPNNFSELPIPTKSSHPQKYSASARLHAKR